MVFGSNTGFGANTLCELFPHIHTEGFCCVGEAMQFLLQIRVQCINLTQCEFAAISSQIHIAFCVSRALDIVAPIHLDVIQST